MNPDFLNIENARSKMIEQQIRPWNVLDPNVLDLLTRVQREAFIPKSHRHLAFVDMEVPLPEHQVMLAPKVEARLLQELNLTPADKALEIGTGSGFMAALIARLAASVLTVEKAPALAEFAQTNLNNANITNVEIVQANGLIENPRWAHVGFDAIAISGAVEKIPDHLIGLLNPGGRLVAITGQAPVMQAVLIERVGDAPVNQGVRSTVLFETLTRLLDDAPKISHFKF
ncbi:MAG: protein-L-isoaspartate O-methyltransferase family protein [Burkholderiales bacterium]|jgi:protein-L-isoaspartate(D-aspartate) O-methyltransferase